MKKIFLSLFIIFSTMSFADYNEVVNKFNLLENNFTKLVNMENQEYQKAINNYNKIEKQIEEKNNFKKSLEARIANLQAANVIKYFKDEYLAIVKEYKTLLVSADEEIKELLRQQKEYGSVIEMKKGGK